MCVRRADVQTKMGDVTFCDCSQTPRHHLPTHVRPECQGLTRHHRIFTIQGITEIQLTGMTLRLRIEDRTYS